MSRPRGIVAGPTFTGDVAIRDGLAVCLLGSPHSRARLVSLDDSRARAIPGVVEIVSSLSTPHLFSPVLRFRGDRVAACAAESADAARRAIDTLVASYETLPASAATPHSSARLEEGDVESAFDAADDTVEATLDLAPIPASALEPRGCWAWPDEDGRIVVRSPSESPYDTRREIASLLSWPEGILRVIQPRLSGGTGSGRGLQHEDLLAFLARSAGRAVRLATRRDFEIATGVHHPGCHASLRGALRAGRLVAVEGQLTFDVGSAGGPTQEELQRALGDLGTLWKLEAVRLQAHATATDRPATTSRVAPALTTSLGALLSAAARRTRRPTASVIEELLVRPSDRSPLGLLSSALRGATSPGTGLGVGCATLGGRGAASVSRHEDASASVSVPQTELGPGIEPDLAALVAASLAVPPTRVVVGPSSLDTDLHALDCGGLAPAWAVAQAVSSAARALETATTTLMPGRTAEKQQASATTASEEAQASVAHAAVVIGLDSECGLPRLERLIVVIDAPAPGRAGVVGARLEGEALSTLGSALAYPNQRSPRAAGPLSPLDAPPTQILFARPSDGSGPFGDRSHGEAVAAAVLAAFRDACCSLGVEVQRIPVHPAAFLQREDRGSL